MIETVPSAREALILAAVAVVSYLLLVACAQWLRRHWALQFGWFFHVFALSAALMDGLVISGWTPSWWIYLRVDLSAFTILCATIPAITVLNRVLWTRTAADGRRADAPRLLADTTGLVVFVGVALVVWHVLLGRSIPTTLLAGSGVAAGVGSGVAVGAGATKGFMGKSLAKSCRPPFVSDLA